MTDWNAWRDRVQALFGLTINDQSLARFRTLHAALTAWNATTNLLSVHSDDELLWRHFADSLAGLAVLDRLNIAGPVADIGTGGGFPGLPVAIARPALPLTLIESIAKKCAFLEHARAALGLDYAVVNDRLEAAGQRPEHRERYAAVLSRAVAKLAPNLEYALPLVAVGGHLLLYKTPASLEGPDGLAAGAEALTLLGGTHADTVRYALPSIGAYPGGEYCIVVVRKDRPTPPHYPRRTGVPEKRPLGVSRPARRTEAP